MEKQCSKCKKMFYRKRFKVSIFNRQFWGHEKVCKGTKGPNQGSRCSKTFTSKSNMEAHMQNNRKCGGSSLVWNIQDGCGDKEDLGRGQGRERWMKLRHFSLDRKFSSLARLHFLPCQHFDPRTSVIRGFKNVAKDWIECSYQMLFVWKKAIDC